jgi:hypothetical protein
MTRFLFEVGYVTNLAVIIITVGYTAVGFIFGLLTASERAERKFAARDAEARDYWRSYYSHPSNR